ncbi:replication initiator protein [Klebsiella pneumoniae]|nr:replication initiator protein [Klebsiella pneumoniae]
MGSCAAPSAKGDDKFITTDYLQQCHLDYAQLVTTLLQNRERHAWRKLDGRNDDGFQVAPFPG